MRGFNLSNGFVRFFYNAANKVGGIFVRNENEIKLIIDSYFEGLSMLKCLKNNRSSLFYQFDQDDVDALKASAYEFTQMIGKMSHVRNPDLFYAHFQYGVGNNFSWEPDSLTRFKGYDPKEFLSEIFKLSFQPNPEVEEINHRLGLALSDSAALSDEQLKAKAGQLFSVEDTSLLVDPDQSILYTKINHGYWEFLLNSFVDIQSDGRFRDLSGMGYPESWRVSGFHAALFDAFESIANELVDESSLKIGVSLSAGDRPYEQTISSDFVQMSRGALAGLTGFIEALDFNQPIRLFEGSAPRDMLKDNAYEDFFGVQLNSLDAVLLLIPPGLKGLEFPKYKGPTYTIVIPGQTVHETYRVSLPTVIGMVQRIKKKHRRVAIITQSAVLAPLVAIYIYLLFKGDSDNISFFDLGRILDVSRPELVANWPSLSWVVKSDLHIEVQKSLRIRSLENPFGLCSLVE